MAEVAVIQKMFNVFIAEQHNVSMGGAIVTGSEAKVAVTLPSKPKPAVPAPPPAVEEIGMDLPTVMDLIQKHVEGKTTIPLAKALLKKYNAKNASELKPADYQAFYDELKAIPLT